MNVDITVLNLGEIYFNQFIYPLIAYENSPFQILVDTRIIHIEVLFCKFLTQYTCFISFQIWKQISFNNTTWELYFIIYCDLCYMYVLFNA